MRRARGHARKLSGLPSAIAIAAAIMFSGCLILPHGAYYKPVFDYPGRRLEGHFGGGCPSWVGPQTHLRAPLPKGVEFRAVFDRTGNDGVFDFYVSSDKAKPGTTLRVAGDSITFRDLDTGRIATVPASQWDVVEWTSETHGTRDEPIDPQAIAAPHSHNFSTRVTVLGFGISHVEVTLPAFEIDGERIELPPIRFDYRTLDLGIYPFNC